MCAEWPRCALIVRSAESVIGGHFAAFSAGLSWAWADRASERGRSRFSHRSATRRHPQRPSSRARQCSACPAFLRAALSSLHKPCRLGSSHVVSVAMSCAALPPHADPREKNGCARASGIVADMRGCEYGCAPQRRRRICRRCVWSARACRRASPGGVKMVCRTPTVTDRWWSARAGLGDGVL